MTAYSGEAPAQPLAGKDGSDPFADFEAWAQEYLDAPTGRVREALVEAGAAKAAKRREALAKRIVSDPKAAVERGLREETMLRLPEAVRRNLEVRVHGRGHYQVLARLPEPGKETTPYERIVEIDGKSYKAHVYGDRTGQMTQENALLEGVAIGEELALLDGPAVESPGGVAARSAWTQGNKTVLYINIKFSDTTTNFHSDATIQSMANGCASFMQENSYGSTTFTSTATPLLTLPNTEAYYITNGDSVLYSHARTAASSAGYNYTSYNLDAVCWKGGPGGYGGQAYVGSRGCWLKSATAGVAAHEFGHNFGLWHANFWTATGESIIGPGSNQEYGDSFDTMGSASAGANHFNAYEKNRLDWLPTANTQTVTASGTYRITQFDQATLVGGTIYALKIQKDTDRIYWLDFRQKHTGNTWLMSGVDLHWDPWASSNSGSHLLDTTPGSPSGKTDSAVVIGRTFSDTAAGIHITPVAKGGTTPQSIDVVVNMGSFAGNAAPTVAVGASATAVAAGTVVNFTATASDANGDALSYYWDFGNNTFGTNSATASKSWSAAGDYVVQCTVTDRKGGVASDSVLVTVGAPTTYRISGAVTSGGSGVQGVRVQAVSGTTTKMSWTNSDGSYDIVGLIAGSWTVSAVKYGFTLSASGFVNPVTVGPNATGVNFSANFKPTVTLSATDTSASETGSSTGTFTITRSGGTGTPLTVNFTRSGSAANISDYSDIGTSVVIPSSALSTTVTITPVDDTLVEGSESVTLALATSSAYTNGSPSSGTVTISDNDTPPLPVVTIVATDPSASETGPDNGLFTFTRTGSTSSSLTVNFSRSGTATNNKDFVKFANTITIPAGAASATRTLVPKDDPAKEGPETVILTLTSSTTYNVGSPGSATVTITSNETPASSGLTANPDPATAGKPVTFTFDASKASGVSFVWDFGDGITLTTSDPTVTHVYASAGEAIAAHPHDGGATSRDHVEVAEYHVNVTAVHRKTGQVATGELHLTVLSTAVYEPAP